MRRKTLFWRINERITAPRIRVIDSKAKLVGILTRTQALRKAKEAGLDLVEIAPRANPPVAKIVDINKFRYLAEKKLRQEKKKTKSTQLKEVRFSPFIADNDYKVRLGKLKEFLGDGHKVRVTVKFLGRQMGHSEFGYKLISQINEDLGDRGQIEGEPKFLGRHLIATVAPIKGGKDKKRTTSTDTSN